MNTRKDLNLDDLRAELLKMREEVEELNKGHDHDADTVEVDSAMGRLSRMDALQQQAIAQETARRRGVELHQIDAALERIEDGSFGECVVCGEEIGTKRLELDPTAATRINCARAGDDR